MSFPICLRTDKLCVVICVDKAPKVGSVVPVTKENILRGGGGCEDAPKFDPDQMVGKRWKVLRGVESTNIPTYFVEEVR